MLYKYIKGQEVLMDEHMLSASEIAELFGIYADTKNNKRPHALLVAAILRDYVIQSNLNVSDYFYPHSRGVMKVYPEIVWKKAMTNFVFKNELDIKPSGEVLPWKIDNQEEKKNFTFVYIKRKEETDDSKIININGRRKNNGK